MVTTNRNHALGSFVKVSTGPLNIRDCFLEIKRIYRDVTSIGDLVFLKWRDVNGRIIGSEKPGRLTNMRGAKASTGSITHARVKRYAHDCHVNVTHLVYFRQAGKRCRTGVTRDLRGINLADLAVLYNARNLLVDSNDLYLTVYPNLT